MLFTVVKEWLIELLKDTSFDFIFDNVFDNFFQLLPTPPTPPTPLMKIDSFSAIFKMFLARAGSRFDYAVVGCSIRTKLAYCFKRFMLDFSSYRESIRSFSLAQYVAPHLVSEGSKFVFELKHQKPVTVVASELEETLHEIGTLFEHVYDRFFNEVREFILSEDFIERPSDVIALLKPIIEEYRQSNLSIFPTLEKFRLINSNVLNLKSQYKYHDEALRNHENEDYRNHEMYRWHHMLTNLMHDLGALNLYLMYIGTFVENIYDMYLICFRADVYDVVGNQTDLNMLNYILNEYEDPDAIICIHRSEGYEDNGFFYTFCLHDRSYWIHDGELKFKDIEDYIGPMNNYEYDDWNDDDLYDDLHEDQHER